MDKNQQKHRATRKEGLAPAFSAYLIWGFLPVYWKGLSVVSAPELLSWRVAGCAVLAWAILLFRRRPLTLKSAFESKERRKGVLVRILAAALLIGMNWGLFLWAIETERMVEASLGYYINPLVNVLLGMIFFSEELGKVRLTALLLAFAGVLILTLQTGVFPWISLGLAFSFGLYGLVTKQVRTLRSGD